MNERQDTSADWASQITNTLENFVSAVRSKTTEPVEKAAKLAVFALMALGVLAMVLLLLTIALVRLLDWVLPIWAAYLILGGIFLLVGTLLWSRRTIRS